VADGGGSGVKIFKKFISTRNHVWNEIQMP